jgi:ComF family protein
MRGFNQAEELCEPLRKQTGLPVVSGIKRVRPTPKQSGLDANERRRNLQQAFAAGGPVDRRHVLIIDDVITTGETCRQLAKVALAAGAEKVSVLAVARA